jgi:hypothetical protein
MSNSVQALFYFLALVCFVGAAFAGFGRSSLGRINLLGLGLAFWVFVPFWNAVSKITS